MNKLLCTDVCCGQQTEKWGTCDAKKFAGKPQGCALRHRMCAGKSEH
jgi:hypothetical protein